MKKLFYSLIGLIVLSSCHRNKIARPMEYYNKYEQTSSIINIPVRITAAGLEKQVDKLVPATFFDDKGSLGENVYFTAKKAGIVSFEFLDNAIRYTVPLDIFIKKEMAFANAQATGKMAISFVTKYQIGENWDFIATTEVDDYAWIEKPVLKLGFLKIPVQSLANLILEKSEKTLTDGIDEQIRKSFHLEDEIKKIWEKLSTPTLISEKYNAWLVFNPERLSMGHPVVTGDVFKAKLIAIGKPVVVMGEKPKKPKKTPLPPYLIIDSHSNRFDLDIFVNVSFDEAEKSAKENLLGYTFSQNGKTAKVEDIEIYGQGNKIVIDLDISGSYNGKIYLTGKPVFNRVTQQIVLKNFDIEMGTKNFLMKSAVWLFKGTIKNKIQQQLKTQIDQNIADIKEMANTELKNYNLANSAMLSGNINNIKIIEAFVSLDGINLKVGVSGEMEIAVE